jgi:hypothetical protein
MKTPKLFLADMRKAKIERLLSTPPRGFWISKGYRRTLSVFSVVVSYYYLITLLLPVSISELLHNSIRADDGVLYLDKLDATENFIYQLGNVFATLVVFSPVILLTCLLLLRSSMRRITSLPDEYLDELEIVNRDWAFKTGYLVIRRVGLVLTVVGFITLFTLYVTTPRTWEWPSPKHPLQDVQDALAGYFAGLTAGGGLAFYFQVIGLLTYVAYSFPIILLAWRESKFNEPLPQIENQVFKEAPVFVKAYLKRVLIVVGGFIASVCIGWFVPYAFMNGLAIMAIILTAWFGLYVYIWSSIKTVEIIRATKEKTSLSTLTLTFFVITHLLGISLATIFALITIVIPGQWNRGVGVDPLALILILGVLMIPAQSLSVSFASKLSKENQLKNSEPTA